MDNFKKNWEIQHNWQLIFPVLGLLILGYCAYILADILVGKINLFLVIIASIVIYSLLLKFILFSFKKLERKWILQYRWEMIRVFIVFSITGSSSVFIGKPIMAFIGITKDNLNFCGSSLLSVYVGIFWMAFWPVQILLGI